MKWWPHNSVRGWKKRYSSKIVSPEAAVAKLKNGDRVYLGSLCAEPRLIIGHLADSKLDDVEFVQLKGGSAAAAVVADGYSRFRLKTFFMGGRKEGRYGYSEPDYVPLFHSDIPRFFHNRRIPIDVAVVQVSKPDRFGQVSLGISVDISRSAVDSARTVIAQVNPKMPRTLGDTFIPVERIDYLVDGEEDLIELAELRLGDEDYKISRYCSELIEDGSILHVGFAGISQGLVEHLKERRNLGVHTEMFTDSVVDLIDAGAVDNSTKKTYRGKSVATFCGGTRRLYDFVNDNPLFEFHPSDTVLDPEFIASNDKMVSVNVAIKVDLRGQIRQGSLGWTIYEGSGGDHDFMRGASLSRGGRSVVCLRSTSPAGRSNIVASHGPKAAVIMNRGDVQFVVSEYGIAYLGGKSIRDRALALIEIAHPDHREELIEKARELGYIYSDQVYYRMVSPELRARIRTDKEFKGGLKAHVRALKATDEGMLRDLFYNLSNDSVYFRYFSQMKSMPHTDLQKYLNLPEDKGISIVVTVGPKENRSIIAEGRFVFGSDKPLAEAAIMVSEDYQGRGIGKYLLNYLIELATERGVAGFKADVLAWNDAMIHLLEQLPYVIRRRRDERIMEIRFRFDELKEDGPRLEDLFT